MNRADAYKQEQELITKQLGYYVSVEHAVDFIQTAAKIVSLIARSSYSVSYKEAKIILRLAEQSLDKITGGIE